MLKYIVFMDNSVVVFSNSTSHKFVAGEKVVRSAGFCRIETYRNQFDDVRAKVSVWGRSDTLNVNSDPSDAELISMMFMQ